MPDGNYPDEGRRLRELARKQGVRLKFRDHALEEMAKDKISQPSVKSMLKRCAVIEVGYSHREETWVAAGGDVLGKRISAVVVAYEDLLMIKVITAWEDRR